MTYAMIQRAPLVLLSVFLFLVSAGCVERKMYIRSDPPGAVVTLNNETPLDERTPVEVPFHFYGDYAVRLTSPGHKDLEAVAPVDPPWWSWPPFDFITEVLWPFSIKDHREFEFTLEAMPPERSFEESEAHNRELVERAKEFRLRERERIGDEGR